MPIVIPPAPPGTEYELLTLDALALNDDTLWMESLSMTPPAKKPEWVSGADSEGALLSRDPKHENRIIEARIRVAQQATHDAVVAHIGSIIDKLQECSRNDDGLPLVWDPANSTAEPLTFRCLMGEITDLPIDWQDSGRFVNAWAFTIRLTCLPFGHEAEQLIATVTSSLPIIPLELPNVPGDVPALGRLVVTDAETKSRRYVAWGLESRWYDYTTSLIIDSVDMPITGHAGTTTTTSGAYGGTTITATLRPQLQVICALQPNLQHIGSFRPQLRYYTDDWTIAVRLTFQALDGPMRPLSFKVPTVVGWNHVDLGLITIPQATLGTQRWTARIEAYSTADGGERFDVDKIDLMPAELYGRARATHTQQPSALAGYDEFLSITSGTALNARVAPLGGTWATSGSTTDFAASDLPAGEETMLRATTDSSGTGRYARLGSTNYTNIDTSVAIRRSGPPDSGDSLQMGLLARYVDASNFLDVHLDVQSNGTVALRVKRWIAGVDTLLSSPAIATGAAQNSDTWTTIRALVYASGVFVAELRDSGGGLLARVTGASDVLATGGTLATGKPGIRDYSNSGNPGSRYYKSFNIAAGGPEPIVCHASQSIEFRHDGVEREDAAGTYAGQPPEDIGSRFTIPNAGGPGRFSRVAVIAKRNDIETAPDSEIADSTIVTVYATPRRLVIPR